MHYDQQKYNFHENDQYSIYVVENTYTVEHSKNLSLIEETYPEYDYIKVSYIYLDYVGANYFLYFIIDISIEGKHFYIERSFDDIDGILDDNKCYFDLDQVNYNNIRRMVTNSYEQAFEFIQLDDNHYFIPISDEYKESLNVRDSFENYDDFFKKLANDFVTIYKTQFLNFYFFLKTKNISFLLNAEKENFINNIWHSFDISIFDDNTIAEISLLPFIDIHSQRSIVHALHHHPIFQKYKNFIINENNIEELLNYINLSEYDLIPYLKNSNHLEDFVFRTHNNELIHYFFEEYVKPKDLHKYSQHFHCSYNFFKNYTIDDFVTFLENTQEKCLHRFVLHNKESLLHFMESNKDVVANILEKSFSNGIDSHPIILFAYHEKSIADLLNDRSLLYYYYYMIYIFKYHHHINPLFIPHYVLDNMKNIVEDVSSSKFFYNTLLYRNYITESEYLVYYSELNYQSFLNDMIVKEQEFIKQQMSNF